MIMTAVTARQERPTRAARGEGTRVILTVDSYSILSSIWQLDTILYISQRMWSDSIKLLLTLDHSLFRRHQILSYALLWWSPACIAVKPEHQWPQSLPPSGFESQFSALAIFLVMQLAKYGLHLKCIWIVDFSPSDFHSEDVNQPAEVSLCMNTRDMPSDYPTAVLGLSISLTKRKAEEV
jgi:hypothetical protein